MLRALRILRNWKAEHGAEFEVKWKRALDANDPKAHEVDQARRKVKSYFQQALKLHQAGYADEKFVRELCSVDGVNILYDIVELLEFALNPGFNRTSFGQIRKIVGRSETGRLIPPVPPPP